MKWKTFEVSANVSLLFTELPYEDRFQAAADAGFSRVESWWPFQDAHPGNDKLDNLVECINDARVQLTGLNFFAGDMRAGERGITCKPERQHELDANIVALMRVADGTGCRSFNLLYGQPDETEDTHVHRTTAVSAYRRAVHAVSDICGVILVEPLAEGLNGTYPLTTHHHALNLIKEIGEGSALLFDTFHLGSNGINLVQALKDSKGLIGHLQLADCPGRGEPCSGNLEWETFGQALVESGYSGTVAAEYKPTGRTQASFQWLNRQRV